MKKIYFQKERKELEGFLNDFKNERRSPRRGSGRHSEIFIYGRGKQKKFTNLLACFPVFKEFFISKIKNFIHLMVIVSKVSKRFHAGAL
jgi:hypothetical protein